MRDGIWGQVVPDASPPAPIDGCSEAQLREIPDELRELGRRWNLLPPRTALVEAFAAPP